MSAARDFDALLARLDDIERGQRDLIAELRHRRTAGARRAAKVARKVEAAVSVQPDELTRMRARSVLQRRAARG